MSKTIHDELFITTTTKGNSLVMNVTLSVDPSIHKISHFYSKFQPKLTLFVPSITPSTQHPDHFDVTVQIFIPDIPQPNIHLNAKIVTPPTINVRHVANIVVSTIHNKTVETHIQGVNTKISAIHHETDILHETEGRVTFAVKIFPPITITFPQIEDHIVDVTKTLVSNIPKTIKTTPIQGDIEGVKVKPDITIDFNLKATRFVLPTVFHYTISPAQFTFTVSKDYLKKALTTNFLVTYLTTISSVVDDLLTYYPVAYIVNPENYELELDETVMDFLNRQGISV